MRTRIGARSNYSNFMTNFRSNVITLESHSLNSIIGDKKNYGITIISVQFIQQFSTNKSQMTKEWMVSLHFIRSGMVLLALITSFIEAFFLSKHSGWRVWTNEIKSKHLKNAKIQRLLLIWLCDFGMCSCTCDWMRCSIATGKDDNLCVTRVKRATITE